MIKLNDPRITAYLLGELDPDEVEVIEQALRSSPTLAKNVEQMRQTIELLKLALPEESLDFSSQTSEQKSDSGSVDGEQSVVYKTDNPWWKFFCKAAIVLIIGLGLYLLCLPKSVPTYTSDDGQSSSLSSQTTEGNNDYDPQLSFDPIDATRYQAPIDKTWEEYGLTSQQVEQLSEQPKQSNANDVVALFPLEAVNRTERMEAYRELHDPDSWQYKTYLPQEAAASADPGFDFFDKLIIENPVECVSVKPKSSFGLVPESVSLSIFQQSVKNSRILPSCQTVRVDQYVNHFHYSLPAPQAEGGAFSVSVQIGSHPWTPGLLLAIIGVRSQDGSEGTIVANDASIEIAFNPKRIKAYRLLGYEKRLTSEESTPYKPIESAHIAANSEVVALYELVLTESPAESEVKSDSNLFEAAVTYRKPDSTSERQTETVVAGMPSSQLLEQTNKNPDFRFAAGVALFAQILQHSEYSGTGNIDTVCQLLQDSIGDDPQRKQFVELTLLVKEEFIKQKTVLKTEDLPTEGTPK